MPETSPAPPAFRIEEEGPTRLVVSLRAPRHPLTMVLLALVLAGWATVLIATLGAAGQLSGAAAAVMLLVWLAGWLVAGALALTALLWLAIGREVVVIDGDTLTLQRRIAGRSRSQSYRLRHLEALRLAPEPFRLAELFTTLRPFGIGAGPVAFDYCGQTVRCGAGLAAAEGEEVCRRLQQRLSPPA